MPDGRHRGRDRVRGRLPSILLCLLVAPLAAAGGTVETPLLVVDVRDGFGDSCAVPVGGLCLFDVQGDGTLANSTVDLRQRIGYVGIATDFSQPRQALGDAWLLPDKELMVNGSSLYVEHPAYRMAREAYDGAPIPEGPYGLDLDEEEVTLRYYGPYDNYDPTGPRGDRDKTVRFAQEQGVRSDSVGPVNAPGSTHSDSVSGWLIPCTVVKGPCAATLAPMFNDTRNATPAVTAGLEFYTMEVATDPSNLTRPETQRGADEAFLPRAPLGGNPASPEPDEESRPRTEHATLPLESPSPVKRPELGWPPPADTRVKVSAQPPGPPPGELPIAAILGTTVAGLFLVALGAGLYSRFTTKAEIMRSQMRDRLVGLIREAPGLAMTDAARALGVKRNTVRHHLRVLQRANVVRVVMEGGRTAWYVVGAPPTDHLPAWLLKNPTCATLARAIQASPEGITRAEAHALLPGVPPRTRAYHIQRLIAVGIVEEARVPEGAKVLRIARA